MISRRVWWLEPGWTVDFKPDGDGVRINVYNSAGFWQGLIVNEMLAEDLNEAECREFLTAHIAESQCAVSYTVVEPLKFKTT